MKIVIIKKISSESHVTLTSHMTIDQWLVTSRMTSAQYEYIRWRRKSGPIPVSVLSNPTTFSNQIPFGRISRINWHPLCLSLIIFSNFSNFQQFYCLIFKLPNLFTNFNWDYVTWWVYTKGQTVIQSSPAWLSTVFYCFDFEETTNKQDLMFSQFLSISQLS